MLAHTTPQEDTPELESFCREISPWGQPIRLDVDLDYRLIPNDCFGNVQFLIDRKGGEVLYGWKIWEIPGKVLEAEFHAIWISPEGPEVDVTPNASGEITILFLPDRRIAYTGQRIPTQQKPLVADELVKEYIAASQALWIFEKEHWDEYGKDGPGVYAADKTELQVLHDLEMKRHQALENLLNSDSAAT